MLLPNLSDSHHNACPGSLRTLVIGHEGSDEVFDGVSTVDVHFTAKILSVQL